MTSMTKKPTNFSAKLNTNYISPHSWHISKNLWANKPKLNLYAKKDKMPSTNMCLPVHVVLVPTSKLFDEILH